MAKGRAGAAVAKRMKLKRVERPTAANVAPTVQVGAAVHVRTGGGTINVGILTPHKGDAGRPQVVTQLDEGGEPILWEVPARAVVTHLQRDLPRERAAAELILGENVLPRDGVEVWADGSGVPDGPGGWGAVLRVRTARGVVAHKEASGGLAKATNNVAELKAIIEGLRLVKDPSWTVHVVSDSAYALGGYREGWILGWVERGWVNKAKELVSNREVWEELIEQVERFEDIHWHHVKGHSKIALNERCDKLAGAARKKIKEEQDAQ